MTTDELVGRLRAYVDVLALLDGDDQVDRYLRNRILELAKAI